MRIGIIGAGNIGATLAGKLARSGHGVTIANSRGPRTIADVAARAGAAPVPLAAIADNAELVIVAIPVKVALAGGGAEIQGRLPLPWTPKNLWWLE